MNKTILTTSIVMCVGFFSILCINTTNFSSTGSFASPLATSSLEQTGRINSTVTVESISKHTESGTKLIAHCVRSCGCTNGCTVGCTNGCSVGCGGW